MTRSRAADQVDDLAAAPALRDDRGWRVAGGRPLTQINVLAPELSHLERASHCYAQVIIIEGLGHVIERPGPHRSHGR